MILLNGVEVQFEKFPNGETHVISKMKETEEHPAMDFFKANIKAINLITFKYESDMSLMELIFVKNHIDAMVFTACDLLIYYMPYSRMDRSEGGSVFTLKYVSALINQMMFDKVYIIEPHSDVTTALIDRSVALMPTKALLDSALNEVQFDLEHDYVIFPDAGAQKRYAKMFGGNVLVGHKHRDFDTGKIVSFDLVGGYNGTGKKAIIVDDLCSYGGTFIATAEALKAKGFEEIYLIVAHAEDAIFKGKIFTESPIKKVFCTDSIISSDWLVWTKAQFKDSIEITPIQELVTFD